jgi:hypothetical protein
VQGFCVTTTYWKKWGLEDFGVWGSKCYKSPNAIDVSGRFFLLTGALFFLAWFETFHFNFPFISLTTVFGLPFSGEMLWMSVLSILLVAHILMLTFCKARK